MNSHLLWLCAAFLGLLLLLIFHSAISRQTLLNEILDELRALRTGFESWAYDEDAYEADDAKTSMIARLDQWREDQALTQEVERVIAEAHLVEDASLGWGEPQ